MEHGNAALQIQENTMQIQPFQSRETFTLALQMANELARSTLVPTDFRGEPGRANCLIAIEIAGRLGISPFMTMQNMHVIHGRPSFSATFLIGMINASGRFTPLQYRMTDENGGTCVAYAKDRRTGETLEGPAVSVKMSKDEGWFDRKDRNGNLISKWRTMPELMLRYRAATFFARAYCPEMALGLQTREEVYDIGPSEDVSDHNIRKINADLLGGEDVVEAAPAPQPVADTQPVTPAASQAAAPEQPADGRNKYEHPSPEKQTKAEAERVRKARAKTVIDLYTEHFGAVDLAQGEIVSFLQKPNSKDWTDEDINKLHGHLKELRETPVASADDGPIPDFGAPIPDANPDPAAVAEEDASFL